MSSLNHDPSSVDESRPEANITPTSSTMKLPQIIRRGSAMDGSEKKDHFRGGTMADQTERKSSLSSLPLRLRRRKTQPTNDCNEQETEAAERLGRLFFSLPSEIITQIVTHLTMQDVFNLRLTGHTFNTILNYNASLITQSVLPQNLTPTTAHHIQPFLYPQLTSHTSQQPQHIQPHSLTHLLTMLRRQHTVNRQIDNLLAFVQMKIYMTRLGTRVLSISDNRSRLIDAFQRPAWFVTHFLERYRDILIHEHPTHTSPSTPNCNSCAHCRSAASQVVASYPAEDVMPAYHFYQLTVEHLQIATRAPMAAGPLERRLRGWAKTPITEETLAIFVVLGGIPEVRKVAMMQGSYNSRVAFVSDFVEKVREAVTVNGILDETARHARAPSVSSPGGSKAYKPGGGGVRRASTYNNNNNDSKNGRISDRLTDTLAPPYESLTQDHIRSLPDITQFFYNVWKERIRECAPQREEIAEPYPWLQRVMAGTGLEFGHSRTPDTPLALGASPI